MAEGPPPTAGRSRANLWRKGVGARAVAFIGEARARAAESAARNPTSRDEYVAGLLARKADGATKEVFVDMHDALLKWERAHMPAEDDADDDAALAPARERAFWRACRQALRACLLAPPKEWDAKVSATHRWYLKSLPQAGTDAPAATPIGAALFAAATPGPARGLAPSPELSLAGTPSAASLSRCASRLLHSETKRRSFVTPYSAARAAPVTESSASNLRTPAFRFLPADTWKAPAPETPEQTAEREARMFAPTDTPELRGGLTPRERRAAPKSSAVPPWRAPPTPPREPPPNMAAAPRVDPARVRALTPAEAARADWLRGRWQESRVGEAAAAADVARAMATHGAEKARADEQSVMRLEASWLGRGAARRQAGMLDPACTAPRRANDVDVIGADIILDNPAGSSLSVYWSAEAPRRDVLQPDAAARARHLLGQAQHVAPFPAVPDSAARARLPLPCGQTSFLAVPAPPHKAGRSRPRSHAKKKKAVSRSR